MVFFRVNIHVHQIESTILIKVDIAIIRMTSSILASFFLRLMKIEIPDFVIESKLYSVSQFIFTQKLTNTSLTKTIQNQSTMSKVIYQTKKTIT